MIQVEYMNVQIDSNAKPVYGWTGDFRGVAAGKPSARIDVTIYADGEDLERFLAFMREAKDGRTSAPALPETTRALSSGPVEAEFVEE